MTIASEVRDAVDLILAQWGRERPDLDCSPMGIIGRISQLQREVHLAQRAAFARHGLDVPSFDVLAALPDHLETERQLLAGLSDDDRAQLADLLRRFLVSLGRLPQEP